MSLLFNSFKDWKSYCEEQNMTIFQPVIEYETAQKGMSETEIWEGMQNAYTVMKEAVQTGLTEDMSSMSGMINNGAKKVYNNPTSVLKSRISGVDIKSTGRQRSQLMHGQDRSSTYGRRIRHTSRHNGHTAGNP